MTPLNPHEQRSGGSGFITGMLAGLGVGLVLACLMSAGGYWWVQRERVNVRKGWNLVPVVVAAQDIAEGTPVTFDLISQRSIPEQFVTASVVKPDQATRIVNQPVKVPVTAGDPMTWQQFDRAFWPR
jgi:pilus assembly protein CpaB